MAFLLARGVARKNRDIILKPKLANQLILSFDPVFIFFSHISSHEYTQLRALTVFATGGLKIEYRDEDGRLLTQKEAFRQMSYKFHGHGPKQKKQEKRRKEINEMEAEAANANKEFGTAANLQRTLTATGKYNPAPPFSDDKSVAMRLLYASCRALHLLFV